MKIVVAPDYQCYAVFLGRLPALFSENRGEVVYKGRNEVCRFIHDNMEFVVKRYKRVNVAQQMVYTFFRKTKACRAFLYAKEFRRRGIDTPREVAYLETTNKIGLFTVGYFVSVFSPGTEASLLLREVKDFSRQLADEVASHIVYMHSRGVLHGDLNLTNFLCNDQVAGKHHFTMIDINRSHFTDGMPTDKQCICNLERLTHRRDLYEYLVRRYAQQRGWDEESTCKQALQQLEHFENKRFKL